MIRRWWPCLGAVLMGLVITWTSQTAWAQDLGQRRVQDMKGRWYVGRVEELPNAYKIRQAHGITTTLKKSAVKAILAVEDAAEAESPGYSAAANSFRRPVSDEEIEELLAGITIATDDIVESADLSDDLPLDEDSMRDMCRLAGVPADDDHVLTKPHFVLVFTTDKANAMRLASRLEAVFRWSIRFMKMLNAPFRQPEHKLEIFYFGTYKEFVAYWVNTTGTRPAGMGVYDPHFNRSAFFDLATAPGLVALLERAADTRRDPKERQRTRNRVKRLVEFHTMTTIQHEAGHQIHFNIGLFPRDVPRANLPVWLVEGTTMMFEFPPTTAGASLGATNHTRLDEFDKAFGRKNKGRRVSPQGLKSFVLDNRVFDGGGGKYYCLGWALVNYLWKKNRAGYGDYLRIISQREAGVDVSYTQREKEFEESFGRIDEQWIDEWYGYLDDLQLKRSVLPPDIPP